MARLETAPALSLDWGARRRRTAQLLDRWPFAGEMLRLCGALLGGQERSFAAARVARPGPADLAAYVAERVVADIVEATIAAGPPSLASAARERFQAGGLEVSIGRWLCGESQPPVDEYLARAAAAPVLEALASEAAYSGRQDDGGCPRCGGSPQLSYFTDSGESLVTAPRHLFCCRCGGSWIHERMTCPACGEQATSKLPIYADAEQLSHLRADACESCRRYLITVDLRRDPEAVPVVDELLALPLDLYMRERGFAKIVPNLMGI